MSGNDEFIARRKARQKEIRRKRRKRLFIFFVFIALVTAVILCFTVFFRIKEVKVTGSNIYDEKQIVSAAGVTDKNMFLLSSEKLADKIRAKLPFVDSLKIKRTLPDKIKITVTDAVPYSYYINKGSFYTVSANGYVLEETAKEPAGLLKIICSGATLVTGKKISVTSEREELLIKKITTELEKNNISVDSVDVSNPVSIRLTVEKRFEVNLGTSDYLDKKINHLRGMINSIEPDKTGVIDLSMWTPENSQGSFMKN